MPQTVPAQTFKNITSDHVSKLLAACIAEHHLNCRHCQVSEIESCKILRKLKLSLAKVPSVQVYKKILDILSSKKIYELCPEIVYSERSEHEENQSCYFLILAFLLAHDSNFDITFEISPLMYKKKDYDLVSKLLNKNTSVLRVSNVINMATGVTIWDGVSLRENRITSLEIQQHVMESWDGSSLKIFGRFCNHLKMFSFECGIMMSDEAFLKFCFTDYPKNKVKNACCYTIETVLLRLFLDPLYNGYYIFLKSMPNLKNTGNCMHFDTFVEHIESEGKQLFPTKLENITLSSTYSELLDSIIYMCPKLKSIACTDEWDFLLSYSPMAMNLESMEFSLKSATEFDIFINKSVWVNLRNLVIYVDSFESGSEPIKCYITDIIKQCPNLEKLDLEPVVLLDVEQPTEEFNCKLSKVKFTLEEIPNLTWLGTVAPTLKSLALNASLSEDEFTDLEGDIVEAFLDIEFPMLEEFNIALSQTQAISICNCRRLISHFPKLKEIHATKRSDAEILLTEIREQNLDLNVGWMYS